MICCLSPQPFLSLLPRVSEAPPDAVARSAVAPATLHLLEPVNAAFFSSKATPWSVNIIYFRFGIDSKVQKEIYYFPIRQDSRLSRACENTKLVRWFEGLLQLSYFSHTYHKLKTTTVFSNGQSIICRRVCFRLCITTVISTILVTELSVKHLNTAKQH